MKIILIPGWAGTASAFEQLLPLPEAETVVVSWADAIGAPEQILEREQAPVVLLGWSLGGHIALAAAAARPGRVAGLVLLSTSTRFLAAKDHPGASPRALARMRRKLREEPRTVLEDFSLQCFPGAEDHPARRRWVEEACGFDAGTLDAGLAFLEKVDLRGALPPTTLPSLVVHGDKDLIIPPEAGKALARTLGTDCRMLEGAGHGLPLMDAARLRPHLERFLNDCPAV